MSNLNCISKLSDYKRIEDICEKNMEEKSSDWLSFDKMIDKSGKQGITGLLKLSNDDKNICVFKISQQIEYLSRHEHTVSKSLNDLASFCPNFCKTHGLVEMERNPKLGKHTSNPFEKTPDIKYLIKEDVLLLEYVNNASKLSSCIRSKKFDDDDIFSLIKQVLLAISIAQTKKKFAHYDLHSDNIMIKKCNKDVVFLYVLDKDNQFCLPSRGYFPIIIDYGFSYIEDMDNNPLWPSMCHMNQGFLSDRFDWVCDPKLFLTTTSSEMKELKPTRQNLKYRKLVKNIFKPLRIDLDSGWDEYDEHENCSEKVINMIEDISEKYSDVFYEESGLCIDLIQSLIILPIENQDTDALRSSYKAFLKEWVKIESQISSTIYNMYVLKGVVDAAREVRADYMNKETTKRAIKDFSVQVHNKIDEISKFCNPKKINYEFMLCSLFVFANSIEGLFFGVMNKKMNDKQKQYDRLPLKSTEQIYATLDSNFPYNYTFNDKTKVVVVDAYEEKSSVLSLNNDQIDRLNDLHNFKKGTFLYDIYKG